MTFACRICRGSGEYPVYTVREMMYGSRIPYRYFSCDSCGCLQIEKIPDDLSAAYPEDYYAHRPQRLPVLASLRRAVNVMGMRQLLGDSSLIGRLINRLYGSGRLPEWPGKAGMCISDHILDVGCGNGKRLIQLYLAGFQNLTGIDPYISADSAYAPGLIVRKQSLEEVRGAYDGIVLHHVFEHIPNPAETMKALAKLLKPGGPLVIRIPVFPSYAWKKYGVDWIQLDAPRHLYLHSRKSIELLARNSGLNLEATVFDSYGLQFLGSEQYKNDIPHTDPRSYIHGLSQSIFSKEDVASFRLRAQALNAAEEGDQAAFYLRKPD